MSLIFKCMRLSLFIFCSVLFLNNSFADGMCKGSYINPLSICWDCLFPITLGNSTVKSGRLPDTPNPHRVICSCGHFPTIHFGTVTGFWEPFALADVTRAPFCFVSLGGWQLNVHADWAVTGDETNANPVDSESFYNVHIYHYPLLQWIPIFPDLSCVAQGTESLTYLSELDPTWHDDKLAAILHPESSYFGNPAVQALCSVDAMSAEFGLPRDDLFYCAGSEGSIYPLMGMVAYHQSGVQASTLLIERASFLMHFYGFWRGTKGEHALCRTYAMPILQKSQYRYQLAYPAKKECEPFGRTTFTWEGGVEEAGSNENYSYVLWRKRNCCMGAH